MARKAKKRDHQGTRQLRKEMGAFIARSREHRGITPVELAGRAGLSGSSYILAMERGERWPRASTLAAILDALGHDGLTFGGVPKKGT